MHTAQWLSEVSNGVQPPANCKALNGTSSGFLIQDWNKIPLQEWNKHHFSLFEYLLVYYLISDLLNQLCISLLTCYYHIFKIPMNNSGSIIFVRKQFVWQKYHFLEGNKFYIVFVR